jgi:hypothetical protein
MGVLDVTLDHRADDRSTPFPPTCADTQFLWIKKRPAQLYNFWESLYRNIYGSYCQKVSVILNAVEYLTGIHHSRDL